MAWFTLNKKSLKKLKMYDQKQYLFCCKDRDYFQVVRWWRSRKRWIASGRCYVDEDMLEEFGFYKEIEPPEPINEC
jgi:hypothetical protein